MATAADRLHLLYTLSRGLTTFADLDELLRYATRQARESFGAEGCAILLLDAERREFSFPVSSQRPSEPGAGERADEARLADIRFPADQGVAGWVLSHDEAALVNDVENDPRFYRGVDQMTHMTTRSLLCAPLRTRSGNLGVIELINAAGTPTADDLEFLEALAADIAVAYEKTLLYNRLRGEVIGLRQVCGWAGFALLAVGMLFVAGAIFSHLALALPLRELPTRSGTLIGLVLSAVGALLVGVGRGWLVAPAHLH